LIGVVHESESELRVKLLTERKSLKRKRKVKTKTMEPAAALTHFSFQGRVAADFFQLFFCNEKSRILYILVGPIRISIMTQFSLVL
jgi:hypothetical protein